MCADSAAVGRLGLAVARMRVGALDDMERSTFTITLVRGERTELRRESRDG